MARPRKQKAEYFPHFVESGRTIFILESTYGNDGYAFWFKLLEILGNSEGHYFDCGNSTNWKFLLAKTHVNEVSASEIIQTLIDLGQVDRELWNEKVLWVQNFVDNLAELYKKRASEIPKKPLLHTETQIKDSFRVGNSQNEDISPAETPQRKGKESIVKDSIAKERKEEPEPLLPLSFPTELHKIIFNTFHEVTYRTIFEDCEIEDKDKLIVITTKEEFKKATIQNRANELRLLFGKDVSVKSKEE